MQVEEEEEEEKLTLRPSTALYKTLSAAWFLLWKAVRRRKFNVDILIVCFKFEINFSKLVEGKQF